MRMKNILLNLIINNKNLNNDELNIISNFLYNNKTIKKMNLKKS